MSFKITRSLVFVLLAISSKIIGATDSMAVPAVSDKLKTLEYRIELIQKDQTNNIIEKELLKEAYSSNLQVLNITLTIVLGAFTIAGVLLGAMGLRSLSAVRKDYKDELEQARLLRESFQKSINEIDQQIESAKIKVTELLVKDADQDERLKLLEIQEKASTYFNNSMFERSFEYAKAGLISNPNDRILLSFEHNSLLRLGKFIDAVSALEKAYKFHPTDASIISNLLETYLLVGDFEKYDATLKIESIRIHEHRSDIIVKYFNPLKLFLKGDDSLIEYIQAMTHDEPDLLMEHIPGWGYSEVEKGIRGKGHQKNYGIFVQYIKYLKGEISFNQLKSQASHKEGRNTIMNTDR